jgi:hypothetical protein
MSPANEAYFMSYTKKELVEYIGRLLETFTLVVEKE